MPSAGRRFGSARWAVNATENPILPSDPRRPARTAAFVCAREDPPPPLRLCAAAVAVAVVPNGSVWDRLGAVTQQVSAVWNTQLVSVDGRSLTVGKMTIALLVLTLGMPVARTVTRRVARRLFKGIGMEPGAASAFETLAFYGVMVGLGLFALWVAEIPLTVRLESDDRV